jgi:transcriptional regulator with XRE-family HTH domain
VTPFPRFLKQLRIKRNLRQNQLAYLLGYEQSYVSALERGVKGPPRADFIQRLIKGLSLDDVEQAQLGEAIKASRRHFSIPRNASDAELNLV